MSIPRLVEILKTKLFGKTRSEAESKLTIYRYFGRPVNGVTLKHFSEALRKFGICLSHADAATFYQHFDNFDTKESIEMLKRLKQRN